jgi:hypothetical protein
MKSNWKNTLYSNSFTHLFPTSDLKYLETLEVDFNINNIKFTNSLCWINFYKKDDYPYEPFALIRLIDCNKILITNDKLLINSSLDELRELEEIMEIRNSQKILNTIKSFMF